MTEITMPKMSDTMEEGKLIRWIKHEGEQVTEGELIAEIETDKANVELETFEPGVIKQILVREGESVPVGAPIATLQAPEAYVPEEKPAVTAPPPPEEAAAPAPEELEKPPTEAPEEERPKASPLARRMAEEHGIDTGKIQGTGPGGRIVEADIENYLKQAEAAVAAPPAPAPAPAAPPEAIPTEMRVPAEERELSKIRKTVAQRMSESKRTIPHFYLTAEIEMDWASRLRDELDSPDEGQPKISFTDLAVKAAALALKQFSEVNASYSDDKLLVYTDINIGMAVALEDGLLAPVIHNADRKSLREIAAETKELAERARTGNLRATDYTGGTFTVSNLGMFHVESFASIINPPQCASLGIGTVTERPAVMNGQVAISKRMKATLSADHRVLDGAVAARFLQEFKRRLETPVGLI